MEALRHNSGLPDTSLMEIYTAVTVEHLLPALLESLTQPLPAAVSPLASEWLLVPNRGMAQWLATQLAHGLGICSGLRWLLPATALRLLNADEHAVGRQAWQLLALLQELPDGPGKARLEAFRAGGRRDMELALYLAERFEAYAQYRPQWLARWRQAQPTGSQAYWQAWLWRRLQQPASAVPELPPRVQIFACQDLSPGLLARLEQLSAELPVTWYVPRLPRGFPGYGLHAGLREASQRALGAPTRTPPPLPRLSLNACGGPLRELEVLKIWLLERLAADPGIGWDDVLIVAPRLQPYQALMPLVMGAVPALPVRLVGQPPLANSALLQGFLQVLSLAGGRLGRQELLALLEAEPVANCFGFSDADLALCRHWLEAVRIRWGWDAEQRRELTEVAFAENSWQSGLDRLVLGYALGAEPPVFASIAPYAEIEGSQSRVLARLLELLEALRQLRSQLRKPHDLASWSRLLADVLTRFLAPTQPADWELLTGCFERLGEAVAVFPAKVPLSRVRSWLRHELQQLEIEALPDGRMRWGPIEVLAGVPARIIAVLGIQDGVFPRQPTVAEIDLLGLRPAAVDADPRARDRESWLSVLQAAREHLWVSYQGIDVRDGAKLPPPLLVSELLETWPGAGQIREHALYPPPAGDGSGRRVDFAPEPLPEPVNQPIDLADLQRFWHNPAAGFLRDRLAFGYGRDALEAADSEVLELDALERFQLREAIFQRSGSLEASYQRLRAQQALPVGRLGRIRFEENANQAELFAWRKDRFEGGIEPQVQPFELLVAGQALAGELWLWPDGQRLHRFGRLRAQDRLDAWLSHLLLQQLALPQAQKFTRLLTLDGELCFAPLLLAEPHLETLLQLRQQGLRQPLVFFPATGLAYAQALRKGLSAEQALQEAEKIWLGHPGQPAESGRPEWEVCFRQAPMLGPAFEALATAVWFPLLDALGE